MGLSCLLLSFVLVITASERFRAYLFCDSCQLKRILFCIADLAAISIFILFFFYLNLIDFFIPILEKCFLWIYLKVFILFPSKTANNLYTNLEKALTNMEERKKICNQLCYFATFRSLYFCDILLYYTHISKLNNWILHLFLTSLLPILTVVSLQHCVFLRATSHEQLSYSAGQHSGQNFSLLLLVRSEYKMYI